MGAAVQPTTGEEPGPDTGADLDADHLLAPLTEPGAVLPEAMLLTSTGRPEANSTGPGTPIPTAQTAAG